MAVPTAPTLGTTPTVTPIDTLEPPEKGETLPSQLRELLPWFDAPPDQDHADLAMYIAKLRWIWPGWTSYRAASWATVSSPFTASNATDGLCFLRSFDGIDPLEAEAISMLADIAVKEMGGPCPLPVPSQLDV